MKRSIAKVIQPDSDSQDDDDNDVDDEDDDDERLGNDPKPFLFAVASEHFERDQHENGNNNSNKHKRQRKYHALSIQQKKEVIDLIDQKKRYDEISKIYGISSGTISNIKENRRVIDEIIGKNALSTNMKQIKCRMNKESQTLDEKLFLWLNAARERNYPVTGPKLIEKAKIICENIGMEFKGSNGWLESFKKRHNISFRNILPLERHPDIPLIDPNDTKLKDWEISILLGDHAEINQEDGSDSSPEVNPGKIAQRSSALSVATHSARNNTSSSSQQQSSRASAPTLQQAIVGFTTFLNYMESNKSVRDRVGITPAIKESLKKIDQELSKIKDK